MASLVSALSFPLGADYAQILASSPASFISGGQDMQLRLRDEDGLWDIQWDVSGNPAFTGNQSHTVLSLLLEHRGEWWEDSTGQRGSVLHTIKQNYSHTPSDIKAAVDQALQPAADAGIITYDSSKTSAKKDPFNPGKVNLSFSWGTQGNQPDFSALLAFNY